MYMLWFTGIFFYIIPGVFMLGHFVKELFFDIKRCWKNRKVPGHFTYYSRGDILIGFFFPLIPGVNIIWFFMYIEKPWRILIDNIGDFFSKPFIGRKE